VLVGGVERGRTPIDVELPRGITPMIAEIQHEGFEPLQQRLVPDVDQRLVLTLDRATSTAPSAAPVARPGGPRPAARKPAPSAGPSAAPSAPKFWRFD
jgi:hypothetical protein